MKADQEVVHHHVREPGGADDPDAQCAPKEREDDEVTDVEVRRDRRAQVAGQFTRNAEGERTEQRRSAERVAKENGEAALERRRFAIVDSDVDLPPFDERRQPLARSAHE